MICIPHTARGVTVYGTDDEPREWYVAEIIGTPPDHGMVVPLKGPYATPELAVDEAVRIGPQKELTPCAMACLLSMLKAGTLKIQDDVQRTPKRRRKW